VILATAPILLVVVWGLAGPWWATAAVVSSLCIAAAAEWDEGHERRVRNPNHP
jgi:hypothetical protein